MGVRVSIQFVNGNDKSVVFFDHWAGKALIEETHDYLIELNAETQDGISMPLDRREPSVIMIDFIAWRASKHGFNPHLRRIRGSWYLGVDENDGDNSDNGHWLIDVSLNDADARVTTNMDVTLEDLLRAMKENNELPF